MDLERSILKNYMSYRFLDIEYKDGMYLIIGRNSENVGEDEGNGAGKTGLISSFPFACYGRVRGVFDKELLSEDYIFMDQDGNRPGKCEVTQFFKQAGKRYKIYRAISLKGAQTLHFHAESLEGEWNDLTLKAGINKRTGKRENGIVRTQQRIIDVIGCDVDLFINSVYFEQSNIDTFARGTLGEKDSIIKAAIGSDRWGDYAMKVSSDIKKIDEQLLQHETLLDDVGDIAELEEQINTTSSTIKGQKSQIKEHEKNLKVQQKNLDTLKIEIAKAEERNKGIDSLNSRYVDLCSEIEELERIMKKTREDIKVSEEQIKSAEVLLTGGSEQLKGMQERRDELAKGLKGYTSQHVDDQRKKSNELANKIARDDGRISALEKSLTGLQALKDKKANLESIILNVTHEALVEQQGRLKGLNEKQGQLSGQMKEIERKGKSVDGSSCAFNSLCGFQPTDTDKEKIKSTLRTEWQDLDKENRIIIFKKKKLDKSISDVTVDLENQKTLESTNKSLAELMKSEKEINAVRVLREQDYNEWKQLDAVKTEMDKDVKLAKDVADADNNIKYKEQEISSAQGTYDRLTAAIKNAHDSTQAQHSVITKKNAEHMKLKEEIDSTTSENIADQKNSMDEISELVKEITESNSCVKNDLQAQETYTTTLNKSLEKVSKFRDKMLGLEESKRIYKYALDVVRKDIPHLLVANMIPELRDHARSIIYKISNGRMDIDFRMDKDLKSRSGEKAHAFDIWVMKDGRMFKYAQTSGGERARADVAIHLAYVCFLATRSESRLQTLFLDEVGAALDKDGTERFIEVIRQIRMDYGFTKVFNISQNVEMRKLIDSKILVTMSGDSSTVKVA